MNVIIYDPYITPEQIEKKGYESVSLNELYQQADYITIHVPKSEKTSNLIDKAAFDRMKDGVMIINCARGGIVNEEDLREALHSGKVAGAALDVFETEPPGECQLFDLDRFICTPHLGASTREAQVNVAVAVAEQIIDYLKTGTITNAVNVPAASGEMMEKIGPYLTLANRMGKLQAQLGEGEIKELIIEYTGDFQRLDLAPISTSVQVGLMSAISDTPVNFVNAPAILSEKGIILTESVDKESEDYTQLLTVKVKTKTDTRSVSGTLFGKNELRIVTIDNFRLELIPEGHILLIFNKDKPGAIGAIGKILGDHGINIGRMQVGQAMDQKKNIIFMQTDTPVTNEVLAVLRNAPMNESVTPLEL